MAEIDRRAAVEFQERAARLRAVPARRSERSAGVNFRRENDFASQTRKPELPVDPRDSKAMMKLYGFWRSLGTYRVKVALALKGLKADEVSIDLLKGKQHEPDYLKVNPQAVGPAPVPDDGGPPRVPSPPLPPALWGTPAQPALLPKDPRGRARVR